MITQAAFKYMGAKWRIAPWIIAHMAPHKIYVEPFGGSAAVLLQKPPVASEVYNDLDRDVYTFFKVLRSKRQAAELVRRLELTPYSRDEYTQSLACSEGKDIEKARKFFIRINMGVGSGKNATSGFWSMRGLDNDEPPSAPFRAKAAQLAAISERFKTVIIGNRPALELLAIYDTPETLFYLDPPYVKETRKSGTNYRCEMDDAAHRELAAALHNIKGKAIVSGYDCQLYKELYGDWDFDCKTVFTYNVHEPRLDCIWIKPGANGQRRLF